MELRSIKLRNRYRAYYKKFKAEYPVEKSLPFSTNVRPENISVKEVGGHFAYLPLRSSGVKILFTHTQKVMGNILSQL